MKAAMLGSASLLLAASMVTARPLYLEAAESFINNVPAELITPGLSVNSTFNPHNITNTTLPGHTVQYTTCRVPGTFAITFDDGTQPNQAEIRHLFDAANATATFFVNGYNYRCIYDPDMVQVLRDTYAAGHQIGTHTWGHTHSAGLTDAQFDAQIALVDEALVKILGVLPAHFRPPYGEISQANMDVLTRHNYTVAALWDATSGTGTGTSIADSNAMYSARARQFPTPHMVLNHEQDVSSVTQILPQAIREIQAAGYKLVSVSECLQIPAYQWIGEPQQRDASWTCSNKPAPGAPQ